MGKQIINVGTNAGDHTGDPLRLALQKAKANFDELYTLSENPLTEKTTLDDADSIRILDSADSVRKKLTFSSLKLWIISFTSIQTYKIITANTTIDNSFHNAIVLIKASVTLTLNAGLRSDLNFVLDTDVACTAQFVAGTSVTVSGTLLVASDSMASLKSAGVANQYKIRP